MPELNLDHQTIIIPLPDAQATQNLGEKLAENLSAGSVILLEGELGAGKTTLVQGIGKELGIEDPIVSPTFTLINEYTDGRLPLYHLDLYRLQAEEITTLYLESYWEALEVAPGITAIEWAQHLPYYPTNYLTIHLNQTSDGARQATIHLIGNLEIDLNQLLSFWLKAKGKADDFA